MFHTPVSPPVPLSIMWCYKAENATHDEGTHGNKACYCGISGLAGAASATVERQTEGETKDGSFWEELDRTLEANRRDKERRDRESDEIRRMLEETERDLAETKIFMEETARFIEELRRENRVRHQVAALLRRFMDAFYHFLTWNPCDIAGHPVNDCFFTCLQNACWCKTETWSLWLQRMCSGRDKRQISIHCFLLCGAGGPVGFDQ